MVTTNGHLPAASNGHSAPPDPRAYLESLRLHLDILKTQHAIGALEESRRFSRFGVNPGRGHGDTGPGPLEEALYYGFTGPQWGDFVDPLDSYRDPDLRHMPYGTAGRGDRRDGYNRPFVWAEIDLDIIRSQARFLGTTNLLAVGCVESLADYTVRTGFKYEFRPRQRYKSDQAARRLARIADQVLEEFCSFDLSERGQEPYTWADREWQSVADSVVDGDVFLRSFDQGDGGCLVRPVAAEQVRQPLGSPQRYSLGILTAEKDVELVEEYAVVYGNLDDWEAVPGVEMSHLKLNVPTIVKRGLSDFYPSIELFDQTRRMVRNMVATGAVQAGIAWIEQFEMAGADQLREHVERQMDQNNPMSKFTRPFTGRTVNHQKIEPGSVPTVAAGREYIPQPTAVNASSHTTTVTAALQSLAARWRMPHYMISGDASGSNYASTFVAGSPFVVRLECRQQVYGRFFVRTLWHGPIRAAARAGRFRVGGHVYTVDEVSELLDCYFTPPQVAIADAAREAEIDHKDITAGVMSLQTRRARRGLDDEQERANLKAEPPTRVTGKATDVDASGNPVRPGGQATAGGPGGATREAFDPFGDRALGEAMIQGRDKRGRRYCTDDGKRVPCPGGEDGEDGEGGEGGGAGAGIIGKAIQAGKGGASRLWRKLKASASARDPKTRKRLKQVARLAAGVEHALQLPGRASRALVQEIVKAEAAKQGAGPAEVADATAKMGRIVGIADAAFSWLASIPVASSQIHGAHLGIGTAGEFALAKLAFYVPVVSLAFVVGSGLADPWGTVKAARKLIKTGLTHEGLMTRVNEAEGGGPRAPDEAEVRATMARLARSLLAAGEESDWYQALVAVALDETRGDLTRAVDMADEAFAKQPTNPASRTQEGGFEESIREAETQGEEGAEEVDPETLAEIFYGIYGEKALEIVRRLLVPDEAAEGLLSEGWDAAAHPRGKGGRFIPKGSAEAVAAAKDAIRKVVAGDASGDPKEILDHLSILTVAQIRQIGKEHGKKIPAMLREDLVGAVAQLVGKPAEGKAAEAPAAKPAAKPGGLSPPSHKILDHFEKFSGAADTGTMRTGIHRMLDSLPHDQREKVLDELSLPDDYKGFYANIDDPLATAAMQRGGPGSQYQAPPAAPKGAPAGPAAPAQPGSTPTAAAPRPAHEALGEKVRAAAAHAVTPAATVQSVQAHLDALDMHAMKKADLHALARHLGRDVRPSDSKARLIDQVERHALEAFAARDAGRH